MGIVQTCAFHCYVDDVNPVQALRTLALGHLPYDVELLYNKLPPTPIELDGEPLPATMSRLTALSSLALHNIGWEYNPGGLPHLPQVLRL